MLQLLIQNFWPTEDGQDLVEYSLLLGFIALVAVAALMAITTDMGIVWNNIGNALTNRIAAGS